MTPQNESIGCYRRSAIDELKDKAKQLIQKGNQLLALARALEEIKTSATKECEGESRHPYIGIGSDAEEALWTLIVSYRGY